MAKKQEETTKETISIADLQQIHETLESLSATAKQVEKQLDSIIITKNAIDTITKTKEDTEILAPLADGIFVKTKLHKDKTLIINIGSETTVEKSADEVKKMIQRHEDTLTKQMQKIEKQIETKGTKMLEMMQSYEASD